MSVIYFLEKLCDLLPNFSQIGRSEVFRECTLQLAVTAQWLHWLSNETEGYKKDVYGIGANQVSREKFHIFSLKRKLIKLYFCNNKKLHKECLYIQSFDW